MSWFAYPLGLAAHLLFGAVPVALLLVFISVVAYAVQVRS